MEMLARYFLDAKGIKAANRAVKGILHYGLNERLTKICKLLDIYSQKVKEKAIIDKGDLASDSLLDSLTNDKRRGQSAPAEPEKILKTLKRREKKRGMKRQPLNRSRVYIKKTIA